MALLNPKRKFIFIHVYKTGGTSLRGVLNGFEVCDFHAPAWQVRKTLRTYTDADLWGECFTFAVVRNPYEFVLSLYHHLKNQEIHVFHRAASKGDVNTFIKLLDTHFFQHSMFNGFMFFHPQWSWFSERGEVILDKVYRFENMPEVFRDLSTRVGIDDTEVFFNVSNRVRNVPYTEVFTPQSIEIINRLYSVDFERYGYQKLNV